MDQEPPQPLQATLQWVAMSDLDEEIQSIPNWRERTKPSRGPYLAPAPRSRDPFLLKDYLDQLSDLPVASSKAPKYRKSTCETR